MNIGVDIIDIDDLKKRIEKSSGLLEKVLSDQEIEKSKLETLAGKIAAKEAVIKTGYIKPGEWLKIQILNTESGKPEVYDDFGAKITSLKVSISHTKNTAVAIAIYEEDKNS